MAGPRGAKQEFAIWFKMTYMNSLVSRSVMPHVYETGYNPKNCPTRMRFSCSALRPVTMCQDSISIIWHFAKCSESYNNTRTQTRYNQAKFSTSKIKKIGENRNYIPTHRDATQRDPLKTHSCGAGQVPWSAILPISRNAWPPAPPHTSSLYGMACYQVMKLVLKFTLQAVFERDFSWFPQHFSLCFSDIVCLNTLPRIF